MNARWLWIALVSALATAQWRLYLNAGAQRASAGRTEMWKPAEMTRSAVRREVLATAEAIAAHRRVGAYASAAVAARRSGRAVDVGPGSSTSPDAFTELADAVDARALAQLESWGLDAPRVAVGLYVPDVDEGWPAGVARPPGMAIRGRIVTGQLADGSPYCIQLGKVRRYGNESADLPWALDANDSSGPGTFGACWLYARYGLPGAATARWIEQTGLEASMATTAEGVWPEELRDATEKLQVAMGSRRSMSLAGGAQTRSELCSAGDLNHCKALFLDPTSTSGANFQKEFDRSAGASSDIGVRDLVAPGTVPRLWAYNPLGEDWLFRLDGEYGSARMAAFWTSDDDDVAAAFEAAFGVDPAIAVMNEVRSRIGSGPTGPTVPVWGWLGLALALGTGIAVSGLVADRRRIA
ncbi:MAG: hypothetical protein HKN71_11525 [Gemmatimonadetes bacterium]|nr:hypothetical protein [Gemmatimonadota bacterium]